MKYKLNSYSIWEQGPREKQEDSIFPEFGKASDSDRFFILCDGMGGHSAGEVASKTVCTALSQSIFAHCPNHEGAFTDEDFRRALNDAFDALDTMDNGAERKMGTTLTFLKLHADGATIAHIGDSRVYHVRPGRSAEDTQILFQTEDHSLINDLIKIGELTPEEAKQSTQKNIITRAMQPGMERRPKADLYHTRDIRPGDYFMLCSDGILEQLEDENIKFIFSDKGGDADNKRNMLIKVTEHNHDNHSAILLQILDVNKEDDTAVSTPKKEESSNLPPSKSSNKKSNKLPWVIVIILLLAFGGYLAYDKLFTNDIKADMEDVLDDKTEGKDDIKKNIMQAFGGKAGIINDTAAINVSDSTKQYIDTTSRDNEDNVIEVSNDSSQEIESPKEK